MTDHMVYGSADGTGERRRAGVVAVVQRCRHAAEFFDDEAVADVVERAGGDARADVFTDHFKHARGQAAGPAHAFKIGLIVDFGSHGAVMV